MPSGSVRFPARHFLSRTLKNDVSLRQVSPASTRLSDSGINREAVSNIYVNLVASSICGKYSFIFGATPPATWE